MTLIISIILLLFFSKRNRIQLLLAGIFIFWAAPMPELLLTFINRQIHSLPTGILNIEELIRGYWGFSTLLAFPLCVLYWQIFTKKYFILFLSPILLTFAAYFGWHFATNTPFDIKYLTLDELWAARYSVTVILRLVLAMLFIVYTLGLLYIVEKLIPIYQKHSQDNYADTAYNIKWIKGVVLFFLIHTTIWIQALFFSDYIFVHILFCISINTIFITLTTNIIFHKTFKTPSEFNINWSWNRGWYLIEQVVDCKNTNNDILPEIDAWMMSQKPFNDNDFCANDLYSQFPNLKSNQLSALLATRGENFQSYIRRLRVMEACSIIQCTPDVRSNELAYQVGFSSPSSFIRSFSSIVGETPTQYKEKTR